jgi:hypothetical protein
MIPIYIPKSKAYGETHDATPHNMLNSTWILHPGGMLDDSPAFQGLSRLGLGLGLGANVRKPRSPEGTADFSSNEPHTLTNTPREPTN